MKKNKGDVVKIVVIAVAVFVLAFAFFSLTNSTGKVTGNQIASSDSSTGAVNLGSLDVTSFTASLKGEKYTCNKEERNLLTTTDFSVFSENLGSFLTGEDDIKFATPCDPDNDQCSGNGVCGKASGYNGNVCVVCVLNGKSIDVSSGTSCNDAGGRLYVQA